ncbi:MAG TPA: VCBS repeat-containing protein [Rudaea sp.]|nr:VCBS repeat-containing protein [Rudaea sp.]
MSVLSKSVAAIALGLLAALAFAQRPGTRELVLYRPSAATFFIKSGEGDTAPRMLAMGAPGDIPLWGDFNGDGKRAPALFRKGTWLISSRADGKVDMTIEFGGQPGDIPLVADVDGDGRSDLVIFRAGEWHVRGSRNPAVAQIYHFGTAGDVPLLADFDGDGKIDLAVFRAGQWYVDTHRTGKADLTFAFGDATKDRPLAADWTGNRKSALVVFRDGEWLVSTERDGKVTARAAFGTKGDIPVAAWLSN